MRHVCPTDTEAQWTHLDGFGDLVDVLRLHDGPQVVLQDLGEVVLQLGASEVGQDLLPVGGVLEEDTGETIRRRRHINDIIVSNTT